MAYIYFHERNIEGKIIKNYKGYGRALSLFKTRFYTPFKNNQLLINSTKRNDIFRKVLLLNDYYRQVDNFLSGKPLITEQSKFRSTILEEFCMYLFKDARIIRKLGLEFYNKKIYSGISLNSKGKPIIRTKDVDFCICKKINMKIDEVDYDVKIPIVAIECKTWLDKTMLNEAQFTSQKIKQGSPGTIVYIITGYHGIGIDEIPINNQTSIDQIYLIGNTRINIDKDTIYNLYNDTIKSIRKISKIISLPTIGRLLY